jgi:CDP-glucose 4,6-dehydratase
LAKRPSALEELGMKFINPNANFWRGKRVLVTGHTGFKGAWLCHWLVRLGAQVQGISLEPSAEPNLFSLLNLEKRCNSHFLDIRDASSLASQIIALQPEVVLHLAAQALVRPSYAKPLDTFSVNIMGTANLLQALTQIDSTKVAVMVTTDKVYSNNEWFWPYRETDRLGGHDPYSASKAASELVIESYKKSFLNQKNIAVSCARAGNVIGGGDWSLDRLIPDAVRAWQSGAELEIRSPGSIRPWQHVLEPLSAYMQLAERTWQSQDLAGAYNFGPDANEAATVREVITQAQTYITGAQVNFATKAPSLHEARLLALDTSKARLNVGIKPRLSLAQTLQMTIVWYEALKAGNDAKLLCDCDIEAFCELA